MRAFLLQSALSGVALWVATLIVPGLSFQFPDNASGWEKFGIVVLVALIFGVVNAFIKPIVQLFSIPDMDKGTIRFQPSDPPSDDAIRALVTARRDQIG